MEGKRFPAPDRKQPLRPRACQRKRQSSLRGWHQTLMEADDLNIESTSGGTQTEGGWRVLTPRQMYISAAVSQLNCLMASGTRRMKVRPADLPGRLQGVCCTVKWQRPPSPSPLTSLVPPRPPSYMQRRSLSGIREGEVPQTEAPRQAPGSGDTNKL